MSHSPRNNQPRPIRVAVVGASGFIGSHIKWALEAQGVVVVSVRSPRLLASTQDTSGLFGDVARQSHVQPRLTADFRGCDAVVNAAGIPGATQLGSAALLGANAVLPRVLFEASARAEVARFVHLSSAAVQGRALLDESTRVAPFSPYSLSKALGERLLQERRNDAIEPEVVLFRPTSVHGASRDVTRSLARVARSPLSSVLRPGDSLTPQVLVENVASAVAFVTLAKTATPPIVLQPHEGLSTTELLRILGGRQPRKVPRWLGLPALSLLRQLASLNGTLAALQRRLEMLWLGQEQTPGWLLTAGWSPAEERQRWIDLADSLSRNPTVIEKDSL